jgi:ferredoxin--NADP+ reductase
MSESRHRPETSIQPAHASLGTAERPLRVAIVGSGPSGFYAAGDLLKRDLHVEAHVFERFPAPFGLVRFGVAPDHNKIRSVIKQYEKTASKDGFHFWGNVTVGRDIPPQELLSYFDAVIFAFGAETDRKLNIPGEDLPRSYTAKAFCAWYNGHPDYRDEAFDLTEPVAVVIGQGNVAMDVTRILAKPIEELRTTDMASHAAESLAESEVKEIHVVGRRGPAQAAFTPKEIKELGSIEGCDIVVDPADLELSETSRAELELEGKDAANRNMEILREFAEREPSGADRRIVLHFCKSPKEIRGTEGVEGVVFEKNELTGEPGAQKPRGTGETELRECNIFFRSIGYHGVPIEGVPFDDQRGIIPNEAGRIEPGLYAVGWIKRGPTGLIGTNKKDAEESVQTLLEDLPHLPPAPTPDDDALREDLAPRWVRPVSYEEWQKIDAAEIERGKAQGKPRDNFTRVEEMLAVLDAEPEHSK